MVREAGEGHVVGRFECRTRILGPYFIGDGEPLKVFCLDMACCK